MDLFRKEVSTTGEVKEIQQVAYKAPDGDVLVLDVGVVAPDGYIAFVPAHGAITAEQVATRRYAAEIGGITISGLQVNTDDRSKLLINGAALEATIDPDYVMQWKTADGFVQLTGAQVIGIARAVRAHVQACFDREVVLLAALEAGTLTDVMLEQGWP